MLSTKQVELLYSLTYYEIPAHVAAIYTIYVYGEYSRVCFVSR